MATTVGLSISRVRNVLKAVKEDPFMTDRFLYSLIMKYSKTLIKRESKMENIYKHKSLFRELPCVDLIDVDKVEACCTGISTGCTIKRSRYKLPALLSIDSGPVIRSVSTLDYSQDALDTLPSLYANMTKTSTFKYNKGNYYWFSEGHIYIPNVDWEAVRVDGIFDEDISGSLCNVDPKDCIAEQDRELAIPEHLFSEIEQMVLKEVLTAGQIPSDGADDGQNVMR
jgi:hypothetical protein